MVARIILLSGGRGVGKSTVCHKTVELAQRRAYTCGGIITLRGARGELDIFDVQSGEVRRLTLEPDARAAIVQGRFRFDPETLAWGNAALGRALPCHLLVVDELGPLEFERGQGWIKALDLLRGVDFALALVVVRPELVKQAQRWLHPNATTILTVTSENRDSLPAPLIETLDRKLDPTGKT